MHGLTNFDPAWICTIYC